MILLPEIETKRLAIKLKPAAERSVKKQHPWIFDQAIIKQSSDPQTGDVAIIYDNKKNKFLACGLFDASSPIRIKLLQFHNPATINRDWFIEKINTAYQLRLPLFATDTNSYRLIYGESDGFPGLIADVYGEVLVIKLYSGIWFPYLKDIFPQLIEVSQAETCVLRLSRKMQRENELYNLHDGQVVHGHLEHETVIFKEHGIRFSANVIHGHKTGYFLDHRHNRKKIGELAKNKTVLDVFSYAGGFSVHALTGGAKTVTSLDISKQALEMATENATLNAHNGKHHIIVADAFEALNKLIHQSKQYDIVVIDPPSFAKRASEVDKAKHSYMRLARLGAQLVRLSGILVLASCSSRVSADDFFEISQNALTDSAYSFEMMEKTFHDIDHPIGFPEAAYLKCGYWKKV